MNDLRGEMALGSLLVGKPDAFVWDKPAAGTAITNEDIDGDDLKDALDAFEQGIGMCDRSWPVLVADCSFDC